MYSACLYTVMMLIHLFATSIQIGPFQRSGESKAVVEVRIDLNLHGIVSIESSTVSKKPNFNLFNVTSSVLSEI